MIPEAAFWGLVSTIPLLIGAYIAFRFRPSPKIVGVVMGFGAGALIAAVAYELIPETSPRDFASFISLGLGAVVFYLATSWIDRRSRRKGKGGESAKAQTGKAIVLGALLDGIPESLVLGMSLGIGGAISVAFLGAVFVSNLPESIGATSEMDRGGMEHAKVYKIWLLVLLVCVAVTILGTILIQYTPGVEGTYVKAFAAGAVLAMLTDSMIPEGFEEGGRLTGLMTVMGFAFASVLALIG
jgi:zinc transporter, ZIP family